MKLLRLSLMWMGRVRRNMSEGRKRRMRRRRRSCSMKKTI